MAGLLFGLLWFPALPFAGRLYAREGLVTFWNVRSPDQPRGTVRTESAPAPAVIAPAPDKTRPLAIMVDDHPDAWPQSGVAEADAVWETLVEGGLTRDMLIFRSASATEIGPVRSSRPYFQLWASEADAVYAHVGGSDEALQDLAVGRYGLDDVDEFKDGKTFWRDKTREAPHNAYTSSDRLRALIAARAWAQETKAVDTALRGAPSAAGVPAARVAVSYSQNGTSVEFRWDAKTSSYDLWRDGAPAKDRDGTQVSPPTVVVMEADVVPIADPHAKGLIGLDNLGSGPATVFRGGQAFRGTWKKKDAHDPTRVLGDDGSQIPFADGQVWYSVVGANRGGGVHYDP